MVDLIFVANYKFIIMKDLNNQEYYFADSQEEAKKEIKLWFKEGELYDYSDLNEKYTR